MLEKAVTIAVLGLAALAVLVMFLTGVMPRYRYEVYADCADGGRLKTRGIGWTGWFSSKIKVYQTEAEPAPKLFNFRKESA